jgi:hypothetical protein
MSPQIDPNSHTLPDFAMAALADPSPVFKPELRLFGKGLRARFDRINRGSSNLLTRLVTAIWNPDILLHLLGISNGRIMFDLNHSSITQIINNIRAQQSKVKAIVIYAHGANRVEDVFVARWVQARYGPLLDAGIYFIAIGWNSDPLRATRNSMFGPLGKRLQFRNAFLRWMLGRLGERLGQFIEIRKQAFRNQCGWVNSLFQLLDDRTIRSIWSVIEREAKIGTTGQKQFVDNWQQQLARLWGTLFERHPDPIPLQKVEQKGPMGFLLDALHATQTTWRGSPPPDIHLIGFSAGSVLCEHAVEYAMSQSIPLASATLWAPGTAMHRFHASYGEALSKGVLGRCVLLNINERVESEEAESNSILLTLQRSAKPGEDIVGLARSVTASNELQDWIKAGRVVHITSEQVFAGRPLCSCFCHSDFDDDPNTFHTTMRLILAQSGTKTPEA